MTKNSPLFVDVGQGLSLMVGLPTISDWATHERPNRAKKGTIGFNYETTSLEFFSGSSWFAAPMTKVRL